MEGAVYVLCATTTFACGVLLLRGWWRSRVRLLLWCSLAFLALTTENIILFIDLVLTGPEVDLSLFRNAIALAGVVTLLIGLVWETK